VKSLVFSSSIGCLLPLFIIANLFLGRIFFNPLHWLLIELGLILIFMLNFFIVAKRITSNLRKRDNVVDVEGEVIKENQKQNRLDKKELTNK
jgi:F0F1-type ATP synthase membrane subunit b/b'